jgi:hypothetical protein
MRQITTLYQFFQHYTSDFFTTLTATKNLDKSTHSSSLDMYRGI